MNELPPKTEGTRTPAEVNTPDGNHFRADSNGLDQSAASPISVSQVSALDAIPKPYLVDGIEQPQENNEATEPLILDGDRISIKTLTERIKAIKSAAAEARGTEAERNLAVTRANMEARMDAVRASRQQAGGATMPRTPATIRRQGIAPHTQGISPTGGRKHITPEALAALVKAAEARMNKNTTATEPSSAQETENTPPEADIAKAETSLISHAAAEHAANESDTPTGVHETAESDETPTIIDKFTDTLLNTTYENRQFETVAFEDGKITGRHLFIEAQRPDGTYEINIVDSVYALVSRTTTNEDGKPIKEAQGFYIKNGEGVRLDTKGWLTLPPQERWQVITGTAELGDPELPEREVEELTEIINNAEPPRIRFDDLHSHILTRAQTDKETSAPTDTTRASEELKYYTNDYMTRDKATQESSSDSPSKAPDSQPTEYSQSTIEKSADLTETGRTLSVDIQWPGRETKANDLVATISRARYVTVDGRPTNNAEEAATQLVTAISYKWDQDGALRCTVEESVVSNGHKIIINQQQKPATAQDARRFRNFLNRFTSNETAGPTA